VAGVGCGACPSVAGWPLVASCIPGGGDKMKGSWLDFIYYGVLFAVIYLISRQLF